MAQKNIRIALIGNPNLGKTTLFNKLSGLRQKTGNYPGVTVDRKQGDFQYKNHQIEVIDLPGINSLFPKSQDEELVLDYLLNSSKDTFPDKLIVLASALNLKRSLYLFDQIRDLEIPSVLVINMIDLAQKRGITIDAKKLSLELGVPVVLISAKKSIGLESLKELIISTPLLTQPRAQHYLDPDNESLLYEFCQSQGIKNQYVGFLKLASNRTKEAQAFTPSRPVKINKWTIRESILRYAYIRKILPPCIQVDKSKAIDLTSKLDRFLVHRVWGYVIFALILFGIFQAVFIVASYPMNWIDTGFAALASMVKHSIPPGYFTDLLTQGIIPGIGGVLIFIPQIAILFFIFSLLEESGYMQRIVYLMDKLMQKFGLSGKSVVPMISGLACAIPAIMSARTIENKKERLITILVTPLMTCSARIPVYIVIIGLIIPDDEYLGIFQSQGIALMCMYLLGFVMTLLVAMILKWIVKTEFKSYLVIDMPEYLAPDIKNVLISVWTNVKSFVWDAGKIILATSIILFVLATNGSDQFNNAEQIIHEKHPDASLEQKSDLIDSFELENSYLGMMGKSIEPAIQPLGYDWKIGIALISSLAAREVFVGTLSTVYAINSDEEMTIRDRLSTEKHLDGSIVFTFATSISLLLFYAFSLQCFSTIAVTYKESKSYKWTAAQFIYMSGLAYFAALLAYQILG
ncbi:MAG: ferrous iron transport protein B [Flavobacteriales bacterium]|nr:ferrous iron transport protein B [Flavobacteriales bacterium]